MSLSRLIFLLSTIIVILVTLFILIFFSINPTFRDDLLKEAAKTLLQLTFIGIVGAYAKFLIESYSKDRQIQQEKIERERSNQKEIHSSRLYALNSLTTSYWGIKKSFHIIAAHRSAKSYGEQIRKIIDYRLNLQRLNNEIQAGLYKFNNSNVKIIACNLSEFDDRLQEVIEEWKSEYLRLSQLQKEDEKINISGEKKVPLEIDKLPVLNNIKKEGFEAIHGPFNRAVSPIRNELKLSIYNKV